MHVYVVNDGLVRYAPREAMNKSPDGPAGGQGRSREERAPRVPMTR